MGTVYEPSSARTGTARLAVSYVPWLEALGRAAPSGRWSLMTVDRPTALALALARLMASASPNAHSGRSVAPRPVTSRSRCPCMQKATGPCVVWKFLAMSG